MERLLMDTVYTHLKFGRKAVSLNSWVTCRIIE